VEKPAYSIVTGVREMRPRASSRGDAIILEGIQELSIEAVRKELGVKIFVTPRTSAHHPPPHRVIKERGRDIDAIVTQYFKSVRPMH
jgi:uridine kinase